MRTKVVVPTVDQSGLDGKLAEHFGRAPYFTVVDIDEKDEISSVKSVPNVGEHFGGGGHMHNNLLDLKPDAIIACGMGPRGLTDFQSAGVAVLKANANTVREVIAAYTKDELQELTEGCHHAHHH